MTLGYKNRWYLKSWLLTRLERGGTRAGEVETSQDSTVKLCLKANKSECGGRGSYKMKLTTKRQAASRTRVSKDTNQTDTLTISFQAKDIHFCCLSHPTFCVGRPRALTWEPVSIY